jgi:hypothetical protein
MRFSFDKDVIRQARDFFKAVSIPDAPSLFYFDEIGRLEADGDGLWPCVLELLGRFRGCGLPHAAVFTVRKQNMELLKKRARMDLGIERPFERVIGIPADERERALLVGEMVAALAREQR